MILKYLATVDTAGNATQFAVRLMASGINPADARWRSRVGAMAAVVATS